MVYKFTKADNLGCSWVAIKKFHPGTQTETNFFFFFFLASFILLKNDELVNMMKNCELLEKRLLLLLPVAGKYQFRYFSLTVKMG